jgi:hypothetical protein
MYSFSVSVWAAALASLPWWINIAPLYLNFEKINTFAKKSHDYL